MPGVSLDIAQVALVATRTALRTLAESHPSMTYPGAPRDHLVVTNHGGWIFDSDQVLRPVSLDRLEDCIVCGDAWTDPEG